MVPRYGAPVTAFGVALRQERMCRGEKTACLHEWNAKFFSRLVTSRTAWRFYLRERRRLARNHRLRLARALGTVSCPREGADVRRASDVHRGSRGQPRRCTSASYAKLLQLGRAREGPD